MSPEEDALISSDSNAEQKGSDVTLNFRNMWDGLGHKLKKLEADVAMVMRR